MDRCAKLIVTEQFCRNNFYVEHSTLFAIALRLSILDIFDVSSSTSEYRRMPLKRESLGLRGINAAVMIWLFTCCAFGQDQDVRRQIGMASAAVGRAIESSDFGALQKLWSPKFVVNSPANRVIGRDEVFAAIKRGELKYSDLKTTVERMDVSENIAIVMGQESYRPNLGPEKGKLLNRRFTNIWQKAADGWVMIARQATVFDPSQTHY
jgi:ketosteroid isomerase-like protein